MSNDENPEPEHPTEHPDGEQTAATESPADQLEDPAAPRHLSVAGEELQDPDAELSDALHVDTLALENFRNPLRLN